MEKSTKDFLWNNNLKIRSYNDCKRMTKKRLLRVISVMIYNYDKLKKDYIHSKMELDYYHKLYKKPTAR